MKASILAIGTELTTGQIINKNAASISEKLKAFGVEVTHHLTVPDEREIIQKSLQFIETQCDLLFITGGLGPTSDDFTRDMVSEWAACKMKFDENSWQQIQERLTTRGFKVRDMQKQQCYFPEFAEILINTEGTANGFKITHKNIDVFVLPGPPREIAAIWRDHINPYLSLKTLNLAKRVTKSWDTLGVGESDVAYQVEELLKDRPKDKYLEIGYRVHLPYVEVKLTFEKKDEIFWSLFLDKVDRALNEITVARDFADITQMAVDKISNIDFTFYDFVSTGYLLTRLSPLLKNQSNWSFKQAKSTLNADFFEHEDDFLALLPYDENKCLLLLSIGGKKINKIIEAPMKSDLMQERRKQYFAEMALVELSRF